MKRYKKYTVASLLTLTVLASLFFLILGRVGAASPAPADMPIRGQSIPALSGQTPTGPADGQQMLHLVIGLNPADAAGLKALIAAQNDPHSTLFHQYLTPQQFTARFAPSQTSVDAVVAFLKGQGLAVTAVAANHLSISVTASTAAVERAFGVQIKDFSLNGRAVYAPTSAPIVPAALGKLIQGIIGLDNVSTPHRIGGTSELRQAQGTKPHGGSGPGGAYAPKDLQTAYGYRGSNNFGGFLPTALVELDGYDPNDITHYFTFYNLGTPNITNVLLDGATGAPGQGTDEVELDMEVLGALASASPQKVYIAPNTISDFYDIFNQIVLNDTETVTTNSWGLCEANTGTSAMQAFDNVFAEGAVQGQAFFSASGDSGAFDCAPNVLSVDFPASDPYVVAVGGTSLTTGNGGAYGNETVWNNSFGSGGGGLSSYFTQPSYQTGFGVTSQYSNGMREVPDVSADADPNTGYSMYCTAGFCAQFGGGGWFIFGGTSAAAPLWAGIAIDLNSNLAPLATLGSANFTLYTFFTTPQPFTPFHDVTSGNNLFYPATAGYDLATGMGTPIDFNLISDLNTLAGGAFLSLPQAVNVATSPGVNPPAQSLVIKNHYHGPLSWTLGSLPNWLTATPSSGTLGVGGVQTITLNFSLGNTAQTYKTNLVISDTTFGFPPLTVPVTAVAATVSKTWYFAEGFTGGSFSEFLTLANPNSVAANVQVQYLLGNASPITRNYLVGKNARFTINVNNEIGPNQNVSMVVTSDQPIIAERPMYFTFTGLPGYSIPGGSDVLGATQLATDFDFGYLDVTAGHATFLTILNQNSTPLTVTINYFAATGGAPTQLTHIVPANSRGTVNVNAEGLTPGSYSALVTLDQPGLVERPLYLKDASGFTGSADVVGVATPQPNWYFAEGFTASTFNERYILSNPSASVPANATVTFLLSNGTTQQALVTLAPGEQKVVDANAVLGSGNVNNSAKVQADQPILAERFISFRYTGAVGGSSSSSIPGASDVLGASAPSNLFYFAEGYSGNQFAEYLTIENPDQFNTAYVTVTFLPANGAQPTVLVFPIVPNSRFTLFTNTIMVNQSFSMVVESNVAIVAERPMYFNFPGGQTGGSDVIGYQP